MQVFIKIPSSMVPLTVIVLSIIIISTDHMRPFYHGVASLPSSSAFTYYSRQLLPPTRRQLPALSTTSSVSLYHHTRNAPQQKYQIRQHHRRSFHETLPVNSLYTIGHTTTTTTTTTTTRRYLAAFKGKTDSNPDLIRQTLATTNDDDDDNNDYDDGISTTINNHNSNKYYEAEQTIKKSRFIGIATYCTSWDDAQAFTSSIKKQHPKARHVCFGFLAGYNPVQERCSDDGEPTGTAGVPILC